MPCSVALHQHRLSLLPSLLENLKDSTQTPNRPKSHAFLALSPTCCVATPCTWRVYTQDALIPWNRLQSQCLLAVAKLNLGVTASLCVSQENEHLGGGLPSQQQQKNTVSSMLAVLLGGKGRDARASPCREPWEEPPQHWNWSADPQKTQAQKVVAVPHFALILAMEVYRYPEPGTTYLKTRRKYFPGIEMEKLRISFDNNTFF